MCFSAALLVFGERPFDAVEVKDCYEQMSGLGVATLNMENGPLNIP